MNLHKKSILITGGNGTLGQATARKALALGAHVFLLDQSFTGKVRDEFECHTLDLCDIAAVRTVAQNLPPIDGLFNIAGGFDMGNTVDSLDDAQWDAMFRCNVTSLRTMLKIFVPGMKARKQGSIVNMGALSARQGQAEMSAYIASKAVVMTLTESLAAELSTSGVRVNAVLPSVIDTPANRAAMPQANPANWVSPQDIANVLCFLASDGGKGINGELLPVTSPSGPLTIEVHA